MTDEQVFDETNNNNIQSDNNASQEAAAAGTPAAEDTASLDAYRRMYDAQSATVNELTELVISLQAQIAKLIAGGANVTDGVNEPLPPEPETSALPQDYTPLYELDFSKEVHPKE